jgi:regulator of protease activity HflC (stomatin/prohibitin superfamily)
MAQAKAEAIKLVNEATPSAQYLQLRSLEAAEKMADGNATKIIVPSDIQNLAATVTAVGETFKK